MSKCEVCVETILPGSEIILRRCNHIFCRSCMEVYTNSLKHQSLVKGSCPSDKDLGCSAVVFRTELELHLARTFPAIQQSDMERASTSKEASSKPISPKKEQSDFQAKSLANRCELCRERFKNNGISLESCGHIFCRACLIYCIESGSQPQIPCPAGCHGVITDSEVRRLVSPLMFEVYLNRSFSQAMSGMDTFHCKTPRCKGWCMFELDRKIFICQLCGKMNCLSCKCQHEGVECDQVQKVKPGDTSKMEELLKEGNQSGWMQFKQALESSAKTSGQNVDSILAELLKADLILNTVEVECIICMCDYNAGEAVILKECFHVFCKECLTGLIESCEEAQVKCPFIKDNYSCACFLQEKEIRSLVSPQAFEKYLNRSLALGERSIRNSFHCKTINCPGWIVYEEDVKEFQCENCQKKNCLECNAQHDGVSCEDHKNKLVQNENDKLSEEAIEERIRKGESMRCLCKAPVDKISGCDWLLCTLCRTELCWATKGPRWGPRGYGDVSGGCKCNVGGRPCHPQCGNCH